MINYIKIKNFKSIADLTLNFENQITNIFWENWIWKTNVLLAILSVFNHPLSTKTPNLVKNESNFLYLESNFLSQNIEQKVMFSFDIEKNKKIYLLNWKTITKPKLNLVIPKITSFFPITMNLFYLWPKYRRDFIDEILLNTYVEYDKILKDYEKILKNRNKMLKSIFEEKSKKEDILFWDEEFIKYCVKIYEYRFKIVSIFEQNISNYIEIFSSKISKIEFIYSSKVKKGNEYKDIKDYLNKNLDRDIMLWKTHIWPHIDDFDILIDWKSIVDFASRWELKSIIVVLKMIEINFIKDISWKTPILLIDDLLSELDENHLNMIFKYFSWIQVISTSISQISRENIDNFCILQ